MPLIHTHPVQGLRGWEWGSVSCFTVPPLSLPLLLSVFLSLSLPLPLLLPLALSLSLSLLLLPLSVALASPLSLPLSLENKQAYWLRQIQASPADASGEERGTLQLLRGVLAAGHVRLSGG